ncbi:DUF4185 domain-containing protein [Paenibacillus sp. V4I5]|uniref:DUF4185 domain-containing protein n=1 Tax=Paenibacillus sp. V4I5 TaxID=3042306 RepID=UPI00278CBC40|nr:DUF4185 domain-containing protein [Paenibacillus sp. V4I5]MDQ0920702.1 hypothetical protein [Paenibacillus sp. V4I5]
MKTFRKKSKCVILVSVASCWMLAGAPSLPAHAVVPQDSTFFSTTAIESSDTINTASQGDLWASCWADDGHLYAANGDGKGFTLGSTSPNSIPPAPPNPDIAVNRISGSIGSLSGATLATNHAVGQIWNTSGSYNRKPTGMVCVNGELYLAVQDLNLDFNDAPNATIAKSTDHGTTWTWNTAAPMFNNHTFTTIMFLDYGQNSAWNTFDNYVYAYGLDNNWRDSFDNTVSDPNKLFLARIPKSSIQNRTTWEFYTGDLNGNATWSSDINLRKPVLQDDRRIYASTRDSAHPSNTSVLSQGGIVYNKALNRYLYTSWTEYTFEFYEAPQPWGPWKKFMTKDFGGYPWSDTKNGGYTTVIPSKYISADGKTMYVQSNTFVGGATNYNFSLRKFVVEPYVSTTAANLKSDTINLAAPANGTKPIEKVAHYGNTQFYNDGSTTQNEDSWDQENKTTDWWGYMWPRNYNMNKLVYTTGQMFSDGGWFSGDLKVQIRRNSQWVDATNVQVGPNYPYNNTAGPNKSYTFTFDDTWGDGIRIIGTPGGSAKFTSISELAVYYASGVVQDAGFENQANSTVSAPWTTDGPDSKGIDRGSGFAHSGANNAWIRTSTTNWNALMQQVNVLPNTNYVLKGWIRNSNNFSGGFFGVRNSSGGVISEVNYGGLLNYTQQTIAFNSGSNTSVTLFVGYWAPGVDSWIQVDDIVLEKP